jgi:hypothetical protein
VCSLDATLKFRALTGARDGMSLIMREELLGES